jgi:antitoxin VapB
MWLDYSKLYLHTEDVAMATGTIFENNRTQAVRLPAETRFPEGVKRVSVRVRGKDRIISPVENTWDSFFYDTPTVSDDFMDDRRPQSQSDRESF